jgi:hypothetical protein
MQPRCWCSWSTPCMHLQTWQSPMRRLQRVTWPKMRFHRTHLVHSHPLAFIKWSTLKLMLFPRATLVVLASASSTKNAVPAIKTRISKKGLCRNCLAIHWKKNRQNGIININPFAQKKWTFSKLFYEFHFWTRFLFVPGFRNQRFSKQGTSSEWCRCSCSTPEKCH